MRAIPLTFTIASLVCIVVGLICLPKRWKTLQLAVLSLLSFALLFFLFLALSAGSNIEAGSGIAMIAGTFMLPIFYPALAGLGFAIRLAIERLVRRQLPYRDILPWILPGLLGLLAFGIEIAGRTQSEVYHDLVADVAPQSVSEFQYWWAALPGDRLYVVRFALNSSDFEKVLSRHKFDTVTDKDQIESELHHYYAPDGSPRWPGLHIAFPKSPLTRMYSASDGDQKDEAHIMDVLTDDARDMVFILGDN
jgi:hypothetical protein